jgi:CDP-paratose 2-epimerase
LELVAHLERRLGRPVPVSFADWRPSDQKVYISDISKVQHELGWAPKITPEQGVEKLIDWVEANRPLFP